MTREPSQDGIPLHRQRACVPAHRWITGEQSGQPPAILLGRYRRPAQAGQAARRSAMRRDSRRAPSSSTSGEELE